MIDLDSSSLDLSSPPANLHSDHVTALVSPTDLPSSQCDAHYVEYDIIDDPLDSDDSPPCRLSIIIYDSVWYRNRCLMQVPCNPVILIYVMILAYYCGQCCNQ